MNGRRLPKMGGANTVDLNLIPFQAIERIDVLKDGASATYGSDALAGVINFILKKDFDGSVVESRITAPEQLGGGSEMISATYGKNFSKGNVLAVYQFRNNKRIWDRDRDWTNGAGRSPFGSPGTYNAGKGFKAAQDCPADRIEDLGNGQTRCTFDFTPFSSGLPDLEQHNALVSANYDINSSVSTFATATYTRRQARWQYAPAPDFFGDQRNPDGSGNNFSIPKASAQKIGLNEAADEDIVMLYRLVEELGPRANRDITDSYGATVGTRGYFGDSWDWEVAANYGTSRLFNEGHAGYGNTRTLFNAIVEGKLRPLAPKGQKGNAAALGAQHVSQQWVDSNISTIQAITSGELGQALGANLSLALGTSAAWEDYNVRVDDVTARGELFGGAGENGQGSRNYQAVFTELGMNYDTLEVQLAGRVDSYSDFGSSFNPKLGMRYKPLQSLMFRGSVGTGFRAPSLDQLYSSSSYGFPTFIDPIACARNGGSDCRAQQYRTFSGGNPDLKEETSFSYNIGTVIQPTRSLDITVDYWVTEVENAVGGNLNNIMLAEQRLGAGALAANGVTVNRDDDKRIVSVFAPNLNLAAERSEGVDFGLGYTARIGALTIRPRIDHSYMIVNEEEAFPGLGFINNLDEAGIPRWRNTSSLTLGLYNHGLRIMARTIAGQFKDTHLFDKEYKGRMPDYTEYDLNYDYGFQWGGRLQVGAKNILGSTPPLDQTAGFQGILDTSLYSAIGRLYYLGYSQTF